MRAGLSTSEGTSRALAEASSSEAGAGCGAAGRYAVVLRGTRRLRPSEFAARAGRGAAPRLWTQEGGCSLEATWSTLFYNLSFLPVMLMQERICCCCNMQWSGAHDHQVAAGYTLCNLSAQLAHSSSIPRAVQCGTAAMPPPSFARICPGREGPKAPLLHFNVLRSPPLPLIDPLRHPPHQQQQHAAAADRQQHEGSEHATRHVARCCRLVALSLLL